MHNILSENSVLYHFFLLDTHTFEKENEVLGNEELNESQLSQAQEMDYSQVDIDEIPTNKSFLNKVKVKVYWLVCPETPIKCFTSTKRCI